MQYFCPIGTISFVFCFLSWMGTPKNNKYRDGTCTWTQLIKRQIYTACMYNFCWTLMFYFLLTVILSVEYCFCLFSVTAFNINFALLLHFIFPYWCVPVCIKKAVGESILALRYCQNMCVSMTQQECICCCSQFSCFSSTGNAFLAALNSGRKAILLSSSGEKPVVCQKLTRELQKEGVAGNEEDS